MRQRIEFLNKQDQGRLVRISHDNNDPTEAQYVDNKKILLRTALMTSMISL
jgi:hypothetical protein